MVGRVERLRNNVGNTGIEANKSKEDRTKRKIGLSSTDGLKEAVIDMFVKPAERAVNAILNDPRTAPLIAAVTLMDAVQPAAAEGCLYSCCRAVDFDSVAPKEFQLPNGKPNCTNPGTEKYIHHYNGEHDVCIQPNCDNDGKIALAILATSFGVVALGWVEYKTSVISNTWSWARRSFCSKSTGYRKI